MGRGLLHEVIEVDRGILGPGGRRARRALPPARVEDEGEVFAVDIAQYFENIVPSGRDDRGVVVEADEHAFAGGVVADLLEAANGVLPQDAAVDGCGGDAAAEEADQGRAHKGGQINALFDFGNAPAAFGLGQGNALGAAVDLLDADKAAAHAQKANGQATLLAEGLDGAQIGRVPGAEAAEELKVDHVEIPGADLAHQGGDVQPVARVFLVGIGQVFGDPQHGVAA